MERQHYFTGESYFGLTGRAVLPKMDRRDRSTALDEPMHARDGLHALHYLFSTRDKPCKNLTLIASLLTADTQNCQCLSLMSSQLADCVDYVENLLKANKILQT